MLSLLVCIIVWSLSLAPNTYAQQLDLSVYPPITEIVTAPAKIAKAPITITNNTGIMQKVKISFKPFEAASLDGTARFTDAKELDPIANTIRVEKNGETIINTVQLRPDETAQLDLIVTPANQQNVGDVYMGVFFQTVNEKELKQTASRIEAGIVSLLLLSIRDSKNPSPTQVRLEHFSSHKLIIDGPISFELPVANEGPHLVKMSGDIILFDAHGNQIATTNLPEQNILAKSTRNLALQATPIESNKLFGLYKAQAAVHVTEDKTLYQTLTFYVIPKKTGIIYLIILIVLIGFAIRLRLYIQKFHHMKEKLTRPGKRRKLRRKNV